MTTPTMTDAAPAAYAPDSSRRALEPVAPSERIAGLDVLRGWAMFGVLLSNLNDWYDPTTPTRLDHALSFAQDWFIESRFYSLLVLLFGIGFAIQLTRARDRGLDLRVTYLRRSAVLLAFGLIHGLLIWHGDVLTSYALAGFALLMFRDATPRQMLAWGAALVVMSGYIGNHLHFALGQVVRVPEVWVGNGPPPWAYAHGTWLEIQRQRYRDYSIWWGYFGLNTFFNTTGAFLLGAWAFRSGLAERVITNRRTTWKFLGVCAAVLAFSYAYEALNLSELIVRNGPPPSSVWTWRVWLDPRHVIAAALDQSDRAGALVYAAIVLLIFQTPRGRRLLAPMAALGMMGLTTYLTQSLICTTLFYSYGLGWFGRVSFTRVLATVLTIYAAQLVISPWWLRRFRFGPAEWLWRTLTYGRAPAMRVRASAAA